LFWNVTHELVTAQKKILGHLDLDYSVTQLQSKKEGIFSHTAVETSKLAQALVVTSTKTRGY
jgi:hypothetical protein